MDKLVALNSHNTVPRKGISWRAIFAGVICIISIVFLLNLLGLVFGFGTIEPSEESNPFSGLGTGTLIWWIATNVIALFAGGYVAARVGVSFYHKSGIIQGLMTWALYTFISAWLVTSAIGGIISGVGNTIGSVLSSSENQQEQTTQAQEQATQKQNVQLTQTLQEVKSEFYSLLEATDKPALDPDRLENKAEDVIQSAQKNVRQAAKNPGQIRAEIDQIFNEARNEFENSWQALDKEALTSVLAERTNMSESEARNVVESYTAKYENMREQSEQYLQQVKQKAQKAAGNVTEAISDAALWLFITLLFGAIVAALGGAAGVKSLRSDYVDSLYIESEHAAYKDRENRTAYTRESRVDYDDDRGDLR